VKDLPVAANSDAMISAIGRDETVHPDFGSYLGYGIPYNVVSSKSEHKVKVSFDFADESDRVGYPIPAHPNQESSGDGHILIVDRDTCRLYELYDASGSGESWKAGSGAVWNLRSNRLRPDPARPRALRRGRRRGDPARAAVHGQEHGQRAHLSRPP
jgi:hypothetical protein